VEPIDRRLAAGWAIPPPVSSGTALLTHASGITTTVGFHDTGDGRLFTAYHEPQHGAHGAVVVCPPILAEAIRSQRRDLALSWELSDSGIAVMRFHYMGSGNSDGEPEQMTFDRLVADAVTVAGELRKRTGVADIAFAGTRLGALVAAAAAVEYPGAALAMWEPPLDMDRYYNEVFRARTIGLLKRGERAGSTKEMMEAFARNGVIDIVGNPLPYSLYETTIRLDLLDLLVAAESRHALIVQMSVKPQLRPALIALVERAAAHGIHIETAAVAYDEAWWFGASGYAFVEVESGALDAIPITTRFLAAATT